MQNKRILRKLASLMQDYFLAMLKTFVDCLLNTARNLQHLSLHEHHQNVQYLKLEGKVITEAKIIYVGVQVLLLPFSRKLQCK